MYVCNICINVFNYLYLYRCKKYISKGALEMFYLFIARLNDRKVVIGACGDAHARSCVL